MWKQVPGRKSVYQAIFDQISLAIMQHYGQELTEAGISRYIQCKEYAILHACGNNLGHRVGQQTLLQILELSGLEIQPELLTQASELAI